MSHLSNSEYKPIAIIIGGYYVDNIFILISLTATVASEVNDSKTKTENLIAT
jgi:hypothetical protein